MDLNGPNKGLQDLEFQTENSDVKFEQSSKTDGDLIARIHGGQALHAFCLAAGKEYTCAPAQEALLEKPEDLVFRDPSMGVKLLTKYFVNKEDAYKFKNFVFDVGCSFCFDEKYGEGIYYKTFSDYTRQMEFNDLSNLSLDVNSSKIVTMLNFRFYPVASFHLEPKTMKLSFGALESLKRLNLCYDTAKRFLQDYGSHIPCGPYHLGGRYCHSLDIRVSRIQNQFVRKNITENNKAELDLAYLRNDDGYSTIFSNTHYDVRFADEENRYSKLCINCKTYHPPMNCSFEGSEFSNQFKTMREWRDFLRANRESWQLIERGLKEVVPIWEIILLNHFEMKREALFLYETWMKMTRENTNECTKKMREMTSDLLPSIIDRCHKKQLQDYIRQLGEINLHEIDEADLLNRHLMPFIWMLSRQDFAENAAGTSKFNQDHWSVFFSKQETVRQLLQNLFIPPNTLKFNYTCRYLCSVLDYTKRDEILTKDGRNLLASFQSARRSEIEPNVPVSLSSIVKTTNSSNYL